MAVVLQMKESNVVLIAMTIISLLLHKYGKPYERGFDCRDPTIGRPFHPVIIPMNQLLFFSLVIPLVTIFAIEYHHKSHLASIATKLRQFYLGLILSFILVLSCKTYFGRLRPNSIDGMCNARHYCTAGQSYVNHFVCDNSVPKLVRESRLSFYSGHSSVGAYAAAYVILYLLSRFRSTTNTRIKYILFTAQLMLLVLGLIPGFTQGINYWHHWSDIGTGYTVGALTAYFIFNYS